MDRPWFEHYDDGVPATLAPYPEQTLVDIVKATAAERPRHTAAIFKGARLSYGELNGLSDGCAAWLAARGVVKGDRVALIMPNCPQEIDRKSTRLNSSHLVISYAVFCLKKKKQVSKTL